LAFQKKKYKIGVQLGQAKKGGRSEGMEIKEKNNPPILK
jgi:hypothetical protein